MAKIVLTISADNKATQSVRLLNKEVETLSTTLSTIKVSKNLTTQINALTKHYKTVADAHAKIIAVKNKEAIADEKLKQAQSKTALAVAKENTELERQNNIKARTEKLTYSLSKAKEKDANTTKITISQTQKLVKQYADLLNKINALEKSYKKGTFDKLKNDISSYFNDVKGLDDSLKSGAITQEEYNNKVVMATATLQGFKTEMATTQTESKNLHGTLKDIVSGFFNFQLGAMLVMKPLQLLRNALQDINETLVKTEDAVIALQRVLPNGSATDNEISSTLYKLAQRYGQEFDNVSQIATNFARTGMSWADTIKATEAALLALNVAELDAEEATTGLVAILSQFRLKASDLETVIDKLNKTADNFPVTTEKILAALQRTGSAADNANLSLDQTIALITALSKATGRSGENIGTALNSLIQYSSKATALDTFANLSEESANIVAQYRQGGKTILDVWKQVSKEIQNLKSNQADLLDSYFATEDGNALKEALDGELQDIYTELGGVYDTANTFRKNYFIALLGNMDTVEQAMGTLDKAAGYSQDENQKYLDTYTAKFNKLKAEWEELANSEQGLLWIKKFFIDIGSGALWVVKHVGGLRTILFAVSTIVWQLKGAKIISGIKSIGTAIKSLTTGLRTATTAAQGLQAALGAIGAIATVVSLVVGIFEQIEEEKAQKIAEDFSNAQESLKDLSESLSKIEEQYKGYIDTVKEARSVLDDKTNSTNKLEEAENSLLKLQSDLIRNNKNYQGSLDLVNGSLDEQLKKLKELEEEKVRQEVRDWLDSNSDATYNADQYLKETGLTILFDEKSSAYNQNEALLLQYLKSKGYDAFADIDSNKSFTQQMLDSYAALVGKDTLQTQLTISNFTREDYIRLFKNLKTDLDTSNYTDEERDYLRAKLTDAINFYEKGDYQGYYELINGNQNSSNWIERLSQQQREQLAKGELSRDEIRKILGLKEEITADSDKWTNNIKDVTTRYDNLISNLQKLRDLEKENTELEEKKKDYLEAQNELIKAQQALENAKNEATVRRFNRETGQWEWQVDEKKVKEAEETVKNKEESVEKAREDLEKQAYDSIIDQLKNNTATNEGLNELLNGLKSYLGEQFINDIKEAIKNSTQVDIDKPINIITKDETSEEKPSTSVSDETTPKTPYGTGGGMGARFDSGGVAKGLGFMPKATNEAESVNDPELTRKILSPVSNAEFNRYVHDMGIMFERSHQYAQVAPIIERVGGNTDNRVNNSGQVFVEKVNVGSEQRDNILSALQLAPLMSDN